MIWLQEGRLFEAENKETPCPGDIWRDAENQENENPHVHKFAAPLETPLGPLQPPRDGQREP